jgi:hypothetical protein
VTLNRQLPSFEHDRQPLLNGVNGPGGHLRGGVPVVGADRAPAEVAAAAAGLVAHQLVDHPGRDAGVLQPGRVGVAEVVGAVQVDRVQQGITGDRQRRPSAGQLVVVVDGGQTGGVQLVQGGRDGGRTGRAAASGGESGGELVDALRPNVTVAEDHQDAPGRRSQRGGRVGQLGQGGGSPRPPTGPGAPGGGAGFVGDPGLPLLGMAREAVVAEVRRVLEVLGQGRAAPPSSRKS